MGFPNFFDRIYLEIIEDPCYNPSLPLALRQNFQKT